MKIVKNGPLHVTVDDRSSAVVLSSDLRIEEYANRWELTSANGLYIGTVYKDPGVKLGTLQEISNA